MSRRFKIKNNKVTRIISVILLISVFLALGGLFVGVAARTTKDISPGVFSVGSINVEDGKYLKNSTTLYTKEKISCIGLEIVPEFDSELTYQVFFYNMDDKYIGYSREYSGNEKFANSVPTNAWYARIMLTPSQLDENGKQIKDFEITRWNARSYAKALSITVDKVQNINVHNIYDYAPAYTLSGEYDVSNTINILSNYGGSFILDNYSTNDLSNPDTLVLAENKDYHVLFVDLSKISKLYIDNRDDVYVHLYAYNEEDGTITKSGYYGVAPGSSIINDVDFSFSDFAVITIKGEPGMDISVYDYLPREIGIID